MENVLKTPESLSSTIKSARVSVKLSQAKLARMCGMSQSMIARLEKDILTLNPSYSAVYKVMDVLSKASENGEKQQPLSKKAAEIMHRNIVFLNHGDTVAKAIRIIKNYDFAYIPVLNERGAVSGTVYQTDILELATRRPTELSQIKIHEIAKPALPQVDEDTSAASLKNILEAFGAVLVVDKGKAIGIITSYDVLKLL